ncbi:MAG: hypothetical protein EB127_17975, partial [Alphaproteobacteria bacterium]|nr:hypothetical protein [Alphaproteobacteria bacterium]
KNTNDTKDNSKSVNENEVAKLDELNNEAEALFTNINDILNRYNDKIKSGSQTNQTNQDTDKLKPSVTKEVPKQVLPNEKPQVYKQLNPMVSSLPVKMNNVNYKGTGGKVIQSVIAPQHLHSLFYNTNVKLTRGQLLSTTWGFISFILFAFSVYATQYIMKRLSEYRENIENTVYNFALVLLCVYTGILSAFTFTIGSWKAFWIFSTMFVLIIIALYLTVFAKSGSKKNEK